MPNLTPAQISDLEKLETIIERTKQHFVECGNALQQIQVFQLYKRDYDTFEAYCQKRWGFSRQRASQLMISASVVQGLPKRLSTTVDNEWAARELSKVPETDRAEVVREAKRNGAVTAPSIRQAAEKVAQAEPPPKPEPEEPEVPVDTMGFPLPKVALPFWERRQEIQDLLTNISKVRSALKRYLDTNDGWLTDLHGHAGHLLNQVYIEIADRKPDVVCPYCGGTFKYRTEYGTQDCKACRGTGLLSKTLYDKSPAAFREKRESALKK